MLKVLNLFAGIGGNRKLWKDVEVTAVESNKEIAEIYKQFYPEDMIIIGDAYEYLERNFHKYDFVWASPPCQTHSRINRFNVARRYNGEENIKVLLPDYRLYSLINFLKTYFRGEWVVENTYSDYEPLIIPQQIGRHFIWGSKFITNFNGKAFHNVDKHCSIEQLCKIHNLPLDYFKDLKVNSIDKKQLIRNCVDEKLGLHVFNCIYKNKQTLLSEVSADSSQS